MTEFSVGIEVIETGGETQPDPGYIWKVEYTRIFDDLGVGHIYIKVKVTLSYNLATRKWWSFTVM